LVISEKTLDRAYLLSILGSVINDTKLDDLTAPDDNTDLDATTSRHGLLPKLDGAVAKALLGNGTWGTPTLLNADIPAALSGKTITTSTIDAQLNTFKNLDVFPSQGKFGTWYGGSQTATNGGVWNAATSATAVGTGTTLGIFRTTTGLCHRWSSGTTINGIGGMKVVNVYTERSYNPVMEWQIESNQTTLMRLFAGWKASATAPVSGADPLTGSVPGIMFGVDTGVDNNWHIYQNDASGGSDSTTIANVATLDALPHKFALRAIDASNKFQYAYGFNNLETATWVDINTQIPTTNMGLAPHWFIEGLEVGVAKTFQMYYAQYKQDK
jgi:hypothetical protein